MNDVEGHVIQTQTSDDLIGPILRDVPTVYLPRCAASFPQPYAFPPTASLPQPSEKTAMSTRIKCARGHLLVQAHALTSISGEART
jgi:hypothetical protein